MTRSERMKTLWADPEWKANQRKALKGRTGPPKGKYVEEASCNFGREPWNKGLTVETSESLAAQAQAAKGRPSGMLGKHHRPESIEQISRSNTGKIGPRLGCVTSVETKQLQSAARIKYLEENPEPWDGVTVTLGSRQNGNAITEFQFWFWVWAQGGECWMCGKPLTNAKIVVEHNHETGKIRGLAHVICNLTFRGTV